MATWNSRPILHTTCRAFNTAKALIQQQRSVQHNKYNETSLGGFAIKKQGRDHYVGARGTGHLPGTEEYFLKTVIWATV